MVTTAITQPSHCWKHVSLVVAVFLLGSSVVCGSGSMIVEDGLKSLQKVELPEGVEGPESIAFDCNGGGPYVGVSDGRILKWHSSSAAAAQLGGKWVEFAIPSHNRDRKACDGSTNPKLEPNCGRPLGLKFNPLTCELYIADAYFGLLAVGPQGGVAKVLVSSSPQGIPFRFLNALDIDSTTGIVYFTDTSLYFQRWDWILSIITSDRTGRLLRYDPRSKKLEVLSEGLAFPNGVALSKDGSFLLVAESSTMRILKFPLLLLRHDDDHDQLMSSSSPLVPELFAQLGRFPDNVKRNPSGDFWVALNSGRGRIVSNSPESESSSSSSYGSWFWKMGQKKKMMDPVGVKLSEDGEVVKVLDGGGGDALNSVSEVLETEGGEGGLWIGSAVQSFVGRIVTN
ncbi:unnamed protein product [Linum trigynum]|uniref:Strictosidine synthase conserved region domain-containing protein n=1 Tax=Linum trigynum TaxID=586398 RepID=A0AAV2GCI9_9ROSI